MVKRVILAVFILAAVFLIAQQDDSKAAIWRKSLNDVSAWSQNEHILALLLMFGSLYLWFGW